MANRVTHFSDYEKLISLIDMARGERSLRKYASDAGMDHNVLNRIKNHTYNPGLTILFKLANASSCDNVTLHDFMIAAGYNIPEKEGDENGS